MDPLDRIVECFNGSILKEKNNLQAPFTLLKQFMNQPMTPNIQPAQWLLLREKHQKLLQQLISLILTQMQNDNPSYILCEMMSIILDSKQQYYQQSLETSYNKSQAQEKDEGWRSNLVKESLIDAQDCLNNWLPAIVIDTCFNPHECKHDHSPTICGNGKSRGSIEQGGDQKYNKRFVKIKYINWNDKYNEWILLDSPRLAPPNTYAIHTDLPSNVLLYLRGEKYVNRDLQNNVTYFLDTQGLKLFAETLNRQNLTPIFVFAFVNLIVQIIGLGWSYVSRPIGLDAYKNLHPRIIMKFKQFKPQDFQNVSEAHIQTFKHSIASIIKNLFSDVVVTQHLKELNDIEEGIRLKIKIYEKELETQGLLELIQENEVKPTPKPNINVITIDDEKEMLSLGLKLFTPIFEEYNNRTKELFESYKESKQEYQNEMKYIYEICRSNRDEKMNGKNDSILIRIPKGLTSLDGRNGMFEQELLKKFDYDTKVMSSILDEVQNRFSKLFKCRPILFLFLFESSSSSNIQALTSSCDIKALLPFNGDFPYSKHYKDVLSHQVLQIKPSDLNIVTIATLFFTPSSLASSPSSSFCFSSSDKTKNTYVYDFDQVVQFTNELKDKKCVKFLSGNIMSLIYDAKDELKKYRHEKGEISEVLMTMFKIFEEKVLKHHLRGSFSQLESKCNQIEYEKNENELKAKKKEYWRIHDGMHENNHNDENNDDNNDFRINRINIILASIERIEMQQNEMLKTKQSQLKEILHVLEELKQEMKSLLHLFEPKLIESWNAMLDERKAYYEAKIKFVEKDIATLNIMYNAANEYNEKLGKALKRESEQRMRFKEEDSKLREQFSNKSNLMLLEELKRQDDYINKIVKTEHQDELISKYESIRHVALYQLIEKTKSKIENCNHCYSSGKKFIEQIKQIIELAKSGMKDQIENEINELERKQEVYQLQLWEFFVNHYRLLNEKLIKSENTTNTLDKDNMRRKVELMHATSKSYRQLLENMIRENTEHSDKEKKIAENFKAEIKCIDIPEMETLGQKLKKTHPRSLIPVLKILKRIRELAIDLEREGDNMDERGKRDIIESLRKLRTCQDLKLTHAILSNQQYGRMNGIVSRENDANQLSQMLYALSPAGAEERDKQGEAKKDGNPSRTYPEEC